MDGRSLGLTIYKSLLPEYLMRTDANPDNMLFAREYWVSIPEKRASVACPGHLKDSRQALEFLHAQALAKRTLSAQIINQFLNRREELSFLLC
jgi:hypothetical protein